MNYSNQEEKKKNPTEGMVGVRKTLRDMGFTDSEIGYDQTTGKVTLGGKALLTPGYLDKDAGVSYARNSDIQKSVVDYYKNSSNPVVRVSDAYSVAAGPYGLSADALTYGNGTVSVGGKPLDVLYIDDEGKAWARQSDVTNAVKNYAESTGVQTPNQLAEMYAERYLTDAEQLLNRLSSQEEFSYNPDTDPVYQAYVNKYRLEGERAAKEAVADLSALTGGYASSAAVTAGAQTRQYYAKKMTDVLPELAQQAYQRYIQKYQTDLSLAGELLDLYDTAYKNAASADSAQKKAVNDVASSNVERDAAAWEKNWKELQNRQNYEIAEMESVWDEALSKLAVVKANLQNQGLSMSNLEEEIYLEYYEMLLQEELLGKQLANSKKGQTSTKKSSSTKKSTKEEDEDESGVDIPVNPSGPTVEDVVVNSWFHA